MSCPNEANLALWVTALRLSAYEKSRIEEIYTGYLLRTFVKSSTRGAPTVTGRHAEAPSWNEPDSPLTKGKMEGWVRVRVMGGTEWKRLWLVITSPAEAERSSTMTGDGKRRRSLFGFGSSNSSTSISDQQQSPSLAGVASTTEFGAGVGISKEGPSAVFYTEPPSKGSTKKGSPSMGEAVLTVTNVSQA